MAKDNRLKKGGSVAFDESLLIGKLSGLSRGAGSTPAAAPPAVEPAKAENDAADQPELAQASADAPGTDVQPEEPAGDREGEKGNSEAAPEPSAPVSKAAAEPAPAGPAAKKPKSGKSWDYGRFLVATETKKRAHVYITDENHTKIKQVISLFGNKLAIADYLDNVLAQHWEQFDPEILERMQQMFIKIKK